RHEQRVAGLERNVRGRRQRGPEVDGDRLLAPVRADAREPRLAPGRSLTQAAHELEQGTERSDGTDLVLTGTPYRARPGDGRAACGTFANRNTPLARAAARRRASGSVRLPTRIEPRGGTLIAPVGSTIAW